MTSKPLPDQENEGQDSNYKNEYLYSNHKNEYLYSNHKNEYLYSNHKNEYLYSNYKNEYLYSKDKNEYSSTGQQSGESAHIVFFEKDDPGALEALRAAIERLNIPIVGLVVKVKEGKDGAEIVNWMFADADFIKSLVFSRPNK